MPRLLFAGGTPALAVTQTPEGPLHGAGLKFGDDASSPRLDRDEVRELVEELDVWLLENGGRR